MRHTPVPRRGPLLRANPPKGGDAELRGYRDPLATPAGPPAIRALPAGEGRRWRPFSFWNLTMELSTAGMTMPEEEADRAAGPPTRPHDRWARLAQRAVGAEGAVVVLWEGGEPRVTGGAGRYRDGEPPAALFAPGGPCARAAELPCGLTLRDAALQQHGVRVGGVAAAGVGAGRGAVLVVDSAPRRWTEAESEALRDVAAAVEAELALAAETASRARAEGALQRSEASFRAVFDNTALGIALIGSDGWLIRTNPALQHMVGLSETELRGRRIAEFIHAEDGEAVRATLERLTAGTLEFDRTECRLVPPGAEVVWTSVITSLVRDRHGRPLCGIALVEDITHRKKAEEALRESQRQLMLSQRMEAVGRLAGGIAHDFNNLLTAIGSFAQLLALEVPRQGDPALYVGEIQKAAARAATLTRQLLAFSRQQVLRPQRLSLNQAVWGLEGMLRRLIGENVELRTDLAPVLDSVRADPGQIEQVLVNLIVNARDAMPRGGRVLIRTRNATLTSEQAESYPYPVRPGAYARITVSDTGMGMDPEVLAHIFEPFFTTKEQGKGTGLGLSTVYGIVKQSGGYVWVYSEPGQGTTFDIYLPALEAAEPDDQEMRALPAVRGGDETILLVEDEEVIRGLAERILTGHGYTVLAADRGDTAIRLFERHAGSIDLLLTDVVMPGMNGRALAEALLARDPDLSVAFMSGYTADTIEQYGVFDPGTAFLDKPFTPDTLARTVRAALDRRGGG